MLRHLQAAAKGNGQHAQSFRHDAREDGRALAAAGHQDAQDALVGEDRERLLAQRQHRLADGIADQIGLVGEARLQPQHVGIGGRDGRDLTRDQPVHAAKDRVLIVNDRRNLLGKAAQQRGQRRIAAEAADRRGLELS